MDFEQLLQEVMQLREEVKKLRVDLAALQREVVAGAGLLQRAIRARGIELHRKNPQDDLVFPLESTPDERTAFYELLKHYSFRLLLRDVIGKKEHFCAEDLVRYCSLKSAKQYISVLCELKVIEPISVESFRLVKTTVSSFGPTLEWFVAEMLEREFCSPACYGVRFKNTPNGGDYDVIALWEGHLVYVEIKSSPPRGIERGEIGAFLARITCLLPDVAFLFNDTQLRMKDKLVPMFEEELYEHHGNDSIDLFPVRRLVEELFHINHRIYIINSKKDVATNFATCLRDFLSSQRATTLPISPPRRKDA